MRPSALPGLLQFGQAAVRQAIAACAADSTCGTLLAVDATCGNGHDTLFLAKSLRELANGKPCRIIALDIQQQALDNARQLLGCHGLDSAVRLLLRNHAELGSVLAEMEKSTTTEAKPAAVMYNLGYLPGSDKHVVTLRQSTLASLGAATERLTHKGLLSIHAYGGHPGGLDELEAVDAWCAELDPAIWTAARYSMHNKIRKPEVLFLLQRRASV